MITVESMTSDEYVTWRQALDAHYAEAKASSGVWSGDESLRRATAENDALLPLGAQTERMLVLRAFDDGTAFGSIWIGLDHPRGVAGAAFLYDIEVDENVRGHGYGRPLLAAAELAAVDAGARGLGLNVFGSNFVARRLYETSGYDVVSMLLLKTFD